MLLLCLQCECFTFVNNQQHNQAIMLEHNGKGTQTEAQSAGRPAHPELLPDFFLLLLRNAQRLLNTCQLPCDVLLQIGVHLVLSPERASSIIL
jgi:hypothetical protein